MQRYTLNAEGRERPQVLANAHAFLDRLPPNRSWRIEIREARKERSGDQNAALWGVAYPPIMDAVGLEGEAEKLQLHATFCGDFFGWIEKAMVGRVPRRTTTTNEAGERDPIDTATMARFYDFVQRTAAEYGVDVPSPDPLWFERRAA